MAGSGSLSGTGAASGCTWSSATAPGEFAPDTAFGVNSTFGATGNGSIAANGVGFRQRTIVQWTAAKLAANGCNPDDASRIVITNARFGYHVNNSDGVLSTDRDVRVRGYGKRTSVAAETWNLAVAEGLDGVGTPFDFTTTPDSGVQSHTGAALNALIQEQIRADGLISLIAHFLNDTTFSDLQRWTGGSDNTTPYESGQGLSLSFDWSLEAEGPVLDLPGDPLIYRSGSGPKPLDPSLTITSDLDIVSAEVAIMAGEEGDALVPPTLLPSGVTVSEEAGVYTFTGQASASDYEQMLRTLAFQSTAVPSPTVRIVRFFLTDEEAGTSGAVDFNVLVHASTGVAPRVRHDATINIRALAGYFHAPVRDVAIVGDSNTLQLSTTGHTQGLTYAWAKAMGCWGAGISPATGKSNGWPAPVGDVFVGDPHGEGGSKGAPTPENTPEAFQARLWDPDISSAGPDCWDYLLPDSPGGVVWDGADADLDCQYALRSRHPLSLHGGLIYMARVYIPAVDPCSHIYPSLLYGMTTTASAVIWPPAPTPISLPEAEGFHSIAWEIPSSAVIADGEVTGNDGSGVRVRLCHRTDDEDDARITGEFGLLFQSLIDSGASGGVRVNRFISAGGESSRFVAAELVATPLEAIAEYFRFMADGQRVVARNPGLSPTCLVQIMEGLNDAGDSDNSVIYHRGGSTEDSTSGSNTLQGFTDNTKSIINRLRDAWELAGFPVGNLYFLLGGSHPQPTNTFVRTTYVEGITAICADPEYSGNVAGIDGWKLRVPDQMIAAYWSTSHSLSDEDDNDSYVMVRSERDYRIDHNGGSPIPDTAHLNERGYIDWGMRLVGAVMGDAYAAGIVGGGGSSGVSRRSISSGS